MTRSWRSCHTVGHELFLARRLGNRKWLLFVTALTFAKHYRHIITSICLSQHYLKLVVYERPALRHTATCSGRARRRRRPTQATSRPRRPPKFPYLPYHRLVITYRSQDKVVFRGFRRKPKRRYAFATAELKKSRASSVLYNL